MDFTLLRLFSAFVGSLALGFSVGFVYEPLHLFHKIGFTKKLHYLLTDIFFMCLCGFITYFFCLTMLEGSIRGFVIIGEITGFFVYCKLLMPFTDKIYPPFIKICKKIFSKLLKKGRAIMYNISRLLKASACKSAECIHKTAIKVKTYENKRKNKLPKYKQGKNRRNKTKEKAPD